MTFRPPTRLLAFLPLLLVCNVGACSPNPPSTNSKTPKISQPAIDPHALLAPWQKALDDTKRETNLLELRPGPDSLWKSKVGGTPYAPRGFTLPRDEFGKEMHLLAQINFSEMPTLPDFPTAGILQFFIGGEDYYGANIQNEPSEESLSVQKNFRVVFHRSVSTSDKATQRLKAPPASDNLPINPSKPLHMHFTRVHETINTYDIGFDKVFGMSFHELVERLATEARVSEDSLIDTLAEHLGPNDFADKIGGYPSFTQEDPRLPSSRLQLLLQLGSDDLDELEMMWGDSGVAGFFIDPRDLRRQDFSKVMYTWDTH